ncbi:MAG: DUF4301 family protein [Bacteroidales bacterium]|nr:DUF4301 family protein [Bacteroidales bacterium]
MKYMTTDEQVERFRSGFPWMKIEAPATPSRGVEVLSDEEAKEAVEYGQSAKVASKAKFVPASGAASRMFKDLFDALDNPTDEKLAPSAPAGRFVREIKNFAFYDKDVFSSEDAADILRNTLKDCGLGYGSKPKGVLKFHKYDSCETRTAFAEHLVEAQDYMRNDDGSVNLVVTISPEHRTLFETALAEVKAEYEERYGVKYNVEFTYQDKESDTIAVDMENKPFLKEDGTVLRRPAGHGALIYNLAALDHDLVSIKNIDNVSVERMLPLTSFWKKVLIGRALQLRDQIYAYLEALDEVTGDNIRTGIEIFPTIPGYNNTLGDPYATDECQSLCNDIEDFLSSKLCVTIKPCETCRERVKLLREALDRPIRVCGVVKNEGEPGGGPFIVVDKDGCTSLQILEGAQINKADSAAVAALNLATHFNPVDLVCCLKNYKGEKFDLLEFVDQDAGFISSKSYQGRPLKALELPGLWNGAMSRWNTLFVEVPAETFNPVKTVLDLLRPAHR